MRYRRIRYSIASFGSLAHIEAVAALLATSGAIRVASRAWRPAAEVFETAEAVVVRVEIAGVNEEDLEIAVHPDALVVEGVRRCPPCEARRFDLAEIRHGPFRLELPMRRVVDVDRVEASYDRGLLTVVLPHGASR